MSGTIVVCGYGPGISDAVARRFGREGLAVALVGRTEERLNKAVAALEQQKIRAKAFKCDVSDVEAVPKMIQEVHAALGPINVVHWNAYSHKGGDLMAAPAELRDVLDVSVHGLLAAVHESLADLEKTRGAVLVTGGGLYKYDEQVNSIAVGWKAMGLAIAKSAQHKTVGLLNSQLAPKGIFVGEVTVLGLVKGTAFDSGNATVEPDAIAEKFWALQQNRSAIYDEIA